MLQKNVKWNKTRKFGFELEFMDGHDRRQLASELINATTNQTAVVRGYEHTGENNYWVCKTDASASIEIVTPILSGPLQLKRACAVLPVLQSHGFNYSNKCGLHVHVDTSDYTDEMAQTLCAVWVKLERFLLNTVPVNRRNNTYCKLADHHHSLFTGEFDPFTIYQMFCRERHSALNIQQCMSNRRTAEFRFGDMTFDEQDMKNRVRLFVWLVDLCKYIPCPDNMNWFSPKSALQFMGLMEIPNSIVKLNYSPAIQEMKRWLLQKFIVNAPKNYAKDIAECKSLLKDLNEEMAASGISNSEISNLVQNTGRVTTEQVCQYNQEAADQEREQARQEVSAHIGRTRNNDIQDAIATVARLINPVDGMPYVLNQNASATFSHSLVHNDGRTTRVS